MRSKVNQSSQQRIEKQESQHYSDEDYEEGFDDQTADDGLDEMQRIRDAMAKEKKKMERFNEKKGEKVVEMKAKGDTKNPL